jgi:alpha-D-ribose 1-methylphosphonate 5-triphosphate synthase subunit PhnI
MGYVAVSGGREAIDASLALQELKRISSGRIIEPELIRSALPDLVEQVEAEGSLWSPGLASIALKQAAGSVEEAVFLVRAYRSTLERLYTTRTVDTRKMRADRRISAAFKDVPGGQLLGATRDYSHRLITFDLESETSSSAQAKRDRILSELSKRAAALVEDGNDAVEPGYLPKVSDYVRSLDLLSTYPVDDTEPVDITKEPLAFPAKRSAILQALSRGLTQAVIAFGYAAIRGFGLLHPTVGELRRGKIALTIDAPGNEGGSEDDAYYLGSLPVCEVENLIVTDSVEDGVHTSSLDIGYGLVMGSDESKAIAMSVLDATLRSDDVRYPTQDQEFVLSHIDSVEATGFISHLKLPHYVTFQSKLDSALRSRAMAKEKTDDEREGK